MKLMIDIDNVGWNDAVIGYMPARKSLFMGVRAEEVITCKDCKHWNNDGGWQDFNNDAVKICYGMHAEDFCSRGERAEVTK